jgi:hypothetical protein
MPQSCFRKSVSPKRIFRKTGLYLRINCALIRLLHSLLLKLLRRLIPKRGNVHQTKQNERFT